ncbi:uncharacterized protein LOC122373187 isoform X1 [Amphibalanus amphitrite]|uniref:uncharacterized protein LOC122373187 isoform X1 n=1 Tax=Amphibalanus amphitrite TaxID=1232801 RepID=UPI001C907B66|nr:uncharacterized protein LOC122373187 isoform X1 [Amphibalanus amphitrite]
MDGPASNSSEVSEPPAGGEHAAPSGPSSAGSLPVTAEEVGLVLLVLLLWLLAIALFINRWGKIRMLEPYLPAYKMTPRAEALTGQRQSMSESYQRRLSRFVDVSNSSRINSMDDDGLIGRYMLPNYSPNRPRQNSLMVPITSQLTAARKVKSAVDLVSLVIAEQREQRESLSGGMSGLSGACQTNV